MSTPDGQLLAKLAADVAGLSGLLAAEAMPSVLRGMAPPLVAPNRGDPSGADLPKRLLAARFESGAE